MLATTAGVIPISIRPNIHTLLVIMGAIKSEAEYGLVWHVALILYLRGIKGYGGIARFQVSASLWPTAGGDNVAENNTEVCGNLSCVRGLPNWSPELRQYLST